MFDPEEKPRRVDRPEPGYFEMRLVKGGPKVPARILLEHGLWSASIDGKPCGPAAADPVHARGVFDIWLGSRRCDQASYLYRMAVREWAQQHDPDHYVLHPQAPIDLHARPVLF